MPACALGTNGSEKGGDIKQRAKTGLNSKCIENIVLFSEYDSRWGGRHLGRLAGADPGALGRGSCQAWLVANCQAGISAL